jgi:hypothetical protein
MVNDDDETDQERRARYRSEDDRRRRAQDECPDGTPHHWVAVNDDGAYICTRCPMQMQACFPIATIEPTEPVADR